MKKDIIKIIGNDELLIKIDKDVAMSLSTGEKLSTKGKKTELIMMERDIIKAKQKGLRLKIGKINIVDIDV